MSRQFDQDDEYQIAAQARAKRKTALRWMGLVYGTTAG
jgi:hypothetical protein